MNISTRSLSVATVTVLGVCLRAASAQGTVVGAAMPGTMDETFTMPYADFDATEASGCGTTFAGCTGTFFERYHEVAGTIEVMDDCTFRIKGWQFDGEGPAVEWWGSKQAGIPTDFPYPETAIKIGELGTPGSYQVGSDHGGDSDVVVRLGLAEDGSRIEFSDKLNHISVWCEDFIVDFGNAPLLCDAKSPGAASPATPVASNAPSSAPVAETEAGSSTSTEPSTAFSTYSSVGAAAAVGVLGLALI